MRLSRPAKIILGIVTAAVLLVPFAFLPLAILNYFPSLMSQGASGAPPPYFDTALAVGASAMCLATFANYGLVAFYLAHIIKNTKGSDVLRIILGIALFLLPILGMPAYYLIYVWPESPPTWALASPSPAAPQR